MSDLSVFFQKFDSAGTVILLSVLLLISLIIGMLAGRKITNAENFLYSPGEMKGWEFGLSETAYMIAVGTTLILLSSLTFQYGSFFIIVVIISWIASLFAYSKLALKGDLLDFYRKTGAHLGEYILLDDQKESRSGKILLGLICVIISITFWLYFVTEILALKVLAMRFIPSVSVSTILGSALILVILYTTIGGYKGTFRTDIVQTIFFILILLIIIIIGFFKLKPLTSVPFMKQGVPASIIVLVSYIAIGIAALITGLDIWARMRAAEGENKKEGEKGLWWSLVALIPFILVCGFGIYFFSIGNNGDSNNIIPAVTEAIGIPMGLMFVFLIMLTISTADTALITTTQAFEPLFPSKFRTVNGMRFFIITLSIFGLIFALAVPIPQTIQVILLTISFPVALTPIVFARRFSKKRKVKIKTSIVAIIFSSVIGLGIGIIDIEYAYYSAATILFIAFLLYFIGNLIEKN